MRPKKIGKGLKVSTLILLVGIPFVVLLTGGLGWMLTARSITSMKKMVEDKTLEMAITAASLLDGDSLVDLECEDEGTPAYENAYHILKAFKSSNEGVNGELAFIYLCRSSGPGTFEFTIDPSDDPAGFGEELEWTKALDSASKGVPAFDQETYTDRWGTFYSAYAPVFTSEKKISMIVGIDVWANWYNDAVWSHSRYIILVTAFGLVGGIVFSVLLFSSINRRFRTVLTEFNDLDDDVRRLISDIKPSSQANEEKKEDEGDEIMALRSKIKRAQQDLKAYIAYTEQAAYVDPLAKVGSRSKYAERIDAFDRNTPFGIALFDINELKHINDNYGHENGDRAIVALAEALKAVYPEDDIFRIGGDEMVVLLPYDKEAGEESLKRVGSFLCKYVKEQDFPFRLSVSKGITFLEEGDRGYGDVFSRADTIMYEEKRAFYRQNKKD